MMFLSSAALKRMLNFNAPPLKNTAAEPVWKVRVLNTHLGVFPSTIHCFFKKMWLSDAFIVIICMNIYPLLFF